jgi:hypothetical protein
LIAVAAVVCAPQARADTATVEQQLLSLVNSGRGAAMASHAGLRVAGRGHSQDMAAVGYWNHDGAAERVRNAAPDPTESNGAPDDGYTGTWCENVAYESGGSESTIAQRIYDRWRSSSEHLACMSNGDMTAAGVGVYFDGTTYWATLEEARDLTPPNGSAPPPPRPAAPTPTPALHAGADGAAATQAPAEAPGGRSPAASHTATSRQPAAGSAATTSSAPGDRASISSAATKQSVGARLPGGLQAGRAPAPQNRNGEAPAWLYALVTVGATAVAPIVFVLRRRNPR